MSDQDFPFRLEGTALQDIPWLSVNPITGTTAAGRASTVDVLFDSTGLALGFYTGTLYITSNDPLNSRIGVPLILTVTYHNVYLPLASRE